MKSPFSLFLIFLLISCNDSDFLERRPHEVCAENSFNTPNGALEALNGIYDILQKQEKVERFDMLGDLMSPDVKYTGEPGGSDSPFQSTFERFLGTGNSNGIYPYWQTMFTGILRCNVLLEVLNDTENLVGFNESLKQQIIGEVYFLRGLIEFKLLILFAGLPQLQQDFNGVLLGLPFYDHVPPPSEYYVERPSLESSWLRVENDFKQAIPLLPLKSEYTAADLGRASKGAAQAMLAKTYLYTEQWQKAYDIAEEIIQSGEYGLAGDNEHAGPFTVQRTSKDGMVSVDIPAYKWIFQPEGNNNCEDVFSIQYLADHTDGFPENQEGNLCPKYYGPRFVFCWNEEENDYVSQQLDWGCYQPTYYFVETAYKNIGCTNESGEILDPRYKLSVIVEGDSVPYYYDDETVRLNHPDSVLYNPWGQWPATKYSMWKYFADPIFRLEAINQGDFPHNFHYLRYADVLLIAAEAAVHIGRNDIALDYTNRVRERARNCGTTGYPKNLESISLEDVLNERRVELAFEGHSFFDMVRTHRIKTMLDEATLDYGTVVNPITGQEAIIEWGDNFKVGTSEILPIPRSEIELSNGSIRQNPGY
jgi:starch-binding outer membrane protein, SusD/RagB family